MSKEKKILILGGSSDIGRELIIKFLKNGHDVTAHYSKNKKNLIGIKKKYKNLSIFKSNFDKISNKKIGDLLRKRQLNRKDIIINLIGFIDNKSFENYNLDDLINSLKVNALIPNLIVRKNIKHMLKKNWGRIVNCTTVGIKFGGGEFSYNYNLAKHCLEFIPGKYKLWAKKNVLINNIRIGHAKTKIHHRMKKVLRGKNRIKLIPMQRMINPSEMIEYIYFYSTHLNSYMTGETISVSGGE
jgi:3-oxoacyl-[acyl-carrier protein] reductase